MASPRPHLLRHLRVFCAAARALSFKEAAMQLHLTPSAVSHQVKALEGELGIRLFERKTRALELTSDGRRLLEEVEPLLTAVDAVLASLSSRPIRRTLRVTLPPFFASELFVPRLVSFYERAPEIDIFLNTLDPRPAEHPATADVSILLTAEVDSDLVGHELFSLRLCAACSPELLTRVRQLGTNVFQEFALIVHKSRPKAWLGWADEVGLDAGAAKTVIELDSMYAVVRAAERGLGIAMVPTALTHAWFQSGALVRVNEIDLPTSDRYVFVHRRTDAERVEIRELKRWALEEFAPYTERERVTQAHASQEE